MLVHCVLLEGAVLEVSSMFGWLQVGWQVGAVIMSSSSDGAVSHSLALSCSIFTVASVLAGEACALLGKQLGRGLEC
jgi:hypothetical protein